MRSATAPSTWRRSAWRRFWPPGKRQRIRRGRSFAVSGLTTLPPVLLTNRSDVHTLADFRSADRIAVPSATAPQLYLLQMQAEKVFGQYDKLRGQIIVLSHPDAIADLLAAKDSVAGYFSSAPFTEIALADGRIHKVLSAADVIDGKASFLVIGATKAYVAAHPKVAEAMIKAMDEAARIIHDDPRRAAEIYLAHEPSKAFDAAAIAAVLGDIKDEFGSPVHGIAAFADFMGRHGELKSQPQSWKEIVAPALLNATEHVTLPAHSRTEDMPWPTGFSMWFASAAACAKRPTIAWS